VLPTRGRHILDDIPSLPVPHGKLAPSGSAGYCLLFPGMVACHNKYSLPAQFPMKSVVTAATDGLGRRRTSCAIDATVAGAVLR